MSFKHICIFSKRKDETTTNLATKIAIQLTNLNISVSIEAHTAINLNMPQYPTIDLAKLSIDLIIVIGGDGSLLHISKIAANNSIPVLGINTGKIGFLTDISPNKLDELTNIINGDYITESRSMLECHFHSPKKTSIIDIALNDIVLSGKLTRLLNFDILINGELVINQSADGLIIATPTGSTAYALAAGGPIIHPKQNAMLILPICAHRLNSRPLVLSDSDKITLVIKQSGDQQAQISCDGNQSILIPENTNISIQKHSKSLQLIHPKTYSYYHTLLTKLNWEHTPYVNNATH